MPANIKSLAFALLASLSLALGPQTQAQQNELNRYRDGEYYGTKVIEGQIVRFIVIDGDTLPVMDLEPFVTGGQKTFASREDRKRYYEWRRHVAKVYPYAAEAIKLHRQIQAETQNMKKNKRKKYNKKIQEELLPQYEEQLKKLSKTQGYILIKMVERELDQPFHGVIQQLRGSWEATKWQTLGSFYGYNLKRGYRVADDPLLEQVLQDMNIRYD